MDEELWQLQLSFNDRFYADRGGWPQTTEARTVATKDFALHMIKEVTEVFDELSWKMHRAKRGEPDRVNILEELVDCQKFLLGLIQVWGFTREEFIEEFKRKSMVVEQRYAQERMMAELRDKPVVIVDIDGVLANFPACFYDFVEMSEQVFKALPLLEQEEHRRRYRQSGRKKHLPLLPGARQLLQLFKEYRWSIVLLTNRPYEEYYRIYPDTLYWLKENRLPYDAILWARDKGFEVVKNFTKVLFAIDDSLKNIQRLKEAGIKTIKVDPADPRLGTSALYEYIRDNFGEGKEDLPLAELPEYWEADSKLEAR